MMSQYSPAVPLKPRVLMILVGLAEGPNHGYALKEDILARTEGGLDLGPGTLYRTLRDLEERGLIQEKDSNAVGDDDDRKRYYAITGMGRKTLANELKRLSAVIDRARAARII